MTSSPKWIDKWNRNWSVTMTRNKTNRESSEIDSSIFSSIIYDRDSIINQRGKEILVIPMEKMKTALDSHTKIKKLRYNSSLKIMSYFLLLMIHWDFQVDYAPHKLHTVNTPFLPNGNRKEHKWVLLRTYFKDAHTTGYIKHIFSSLMYWTKPEVTAALWRSKFQNCSRGQ